MTREELRNELRLMANEILRVRKNPYNRLKHTKRKRPKSKPRVGAFSAPPRPLVEDVKQYVYIIGCDDHPVKIGYSTNVQARLIDLQVGQARKLRIYHFAEIKDGRGREVEKLCHRRIAHHRLNGEWFDVTPYRAIDLLRDVVDNLPPLQCDDEQLDP